MAHFGLTECLANDNVVIASLLYLILIKCEVIPVLLTQPNQQLDKEHLDNWSKFFSSALCHEGPLPSDC